MKDGVVRGARRLEVVSGHVEQLQELEELLGAERSAAALDLAQSSLGHVQTVRELSLRPSPLFAEGAYVAGDPASGFHFLSGGGHDFIDFEIFVLILQSRLETRRRSFPGGHVFGVRIIDNFDAAFCRATRSDAGKCDQCAGLFEACRAFLEATLDPGVQRIALIDGPTVLGWERLREIENRHALANLRLGFERAMADKLIAARPVEPLLQLLNGALCDAAMFIARSKEPRTALRATLGEFRVMFDALIARRL